MDAIKTIEMSDNRTLKIYQDDNPESPRNWENLGIMACFHNRYELGDKHEFCNEAHYLGNGEWNNYPDEPDGLLDYLKDNKNNLICLPLYLYDHSGLAMRTYRYNRSGESYWQYPEWDAGLVGYIYVTKQTIREEYEWKAITKQREDKIMQYLMGEVNTYNDYLTGNVYGFILSCNICEEELDSCWGYYGDNAIKDIQDEVQDHDCKSCQTIAERLNQLKFEFV